MSYDQCISGTQCAHIVVIYQVVLQCLMCMYVSDDQVSVWWQMSVPRQRMDLYGSDMDKARMCCDTVVRVVRMSSRVASPSQPYGLVGVVS